MSVTNCEWQFKEWDYQLFREFSTGGRAHGTETVPYVVVEAGVHTLADGSLLQAGYAAASSSTGAVAFARAFPGTPVVLSQAASAADSKAVVARQQGIGAGGFVAPGTFVLAMVFLTSFVLYYFVNWKYLSTVWPLR